ncbi:hypothetical protein BaRGS_00039736 [Batillaria attramentaria]|uniref:SH3 domain-containing protein n=1 Tax=Batillaria attramentaria TaxID=370345 RepID=A0ABD0J2E6_9CAEN
MTNVQCLSAQLLPDQLPHHQRADQQLHLSQQRQIQAGAVPPRPSAAPVSPPLARHPDPPASAPTSKLNGKSQGSVKKRPEITIVDARPMSPAWFREVKALQNKNGQDKQGGAPAIPSRPAPACTSLGVTPRHLPPPTEPPPPIPASRPGVPPPVPAFSPHPAFKSPPPVPQHPAPASTTAENHAESLDPSHRPSRPTILRPPRPKSTPDPVEKAADVSTTSPTPVVPKRSPTDIPPPKPARSATSNHAVTEDKNAASGEKSEERIIPSKPTRTSIIRPQLKRKPAVDEDVGIAEGKAPQVADAATAGAPVPPVPAARHSGSQYDQPLSHSERTSDSSVTQHSDAGQPLPVSPDDRLQPPPVPASRLQVPSPASGSRSSDASGPARPPPPMHQVAATGGAGAAPLLAESVPSNVSVVAAELPRPPHPSPPSRPQPPPPPADRPLPSVPSPSEESGMPGGEYRLYEEVEVTRNEAQSQSKEAENSHGLTSAAPASVKKVEDVSALYAKVNKPNKSTPQTGGKKQAQAAAANPFGVKLKHVAADDASTPESEQPREQARQRSQDRDETSVKKPPVTAPRPKPSVLPKPPPAAKPKVTTTSVEPSEGQQLPDTTQGLGKPDDAEQTKPKPVAKRPTIIRAGRPGPKSADSEEADSGHVQLREKRQEAGPRPQSLTETPGDSTEKKSKPEPPIPAKRPVTIIGAPHRHESPRTEIPDISAPVPKRRMSPSVEGTGHEGEAVSGASYSDSKPSAPVVSRPPPPRPDNKPAKASDAVVSPPESSARPDSDPSPARPPSPAPPRPANRPGPKKETASASATADSATASVPSGPPASTLCYAPPVKRKDHSVAEEAEKRQPPRPSGPPSRPASMPPVKSPLVPVPDGAAVSKDTKGEKPPKPTRPAAPKEEKTAGPPLPARPGPSHPLYGYMISEPHGIAVHDYSANHHDELNMQEGDTVVLLKRIDDRWLKGKLPTSAIDDFIDGAFEDITEEKPDLLTGPRCRARFDFEGEGHGDLAFEDGDVIQLVAHCGNDWLKGELNGKVGIFPASFVEIIEDLPAEKSRSAGSGSRSNETVALFDFEGEAGELSFQAGDKILVLSKVNDQWLYGKCQDREGSFPASFVDGVPDDLPLHAPSSPVHKTRASHAEPHESHQPKSYCTALYDFEGEHEGDLNFREGDHIEILEHIGEDWLKGRLHSKEGTFPTAFVQLDSGEKATGQSDADFHGTGLEHHQDLVMGVALFDFEGEADGELTFKAGDQVVLGSVISEGSKWQWGKANGKTGIFPTAFVEIL